MSARPIDMHRLQEAIRLHRLGKSQREISRVLRMGRPTLRRYFRALESTSLLDGEAARLPEPSQLQSALKAALDRSPPPQQRSSLEPWRPLIEAKRAQGASPTAIHDFLRLHHDDYEASVSAVKRFCRSLAKLEGPKPESVTMPVETLPGDVAQVDFVYAGKLLDPARKIMRKAWIFVMTLGFSRFTYAEIVFDQKADTWLQLHMNAFEWLGGVPRVVVPDNLKAAVIRAAFGSDEVAVLNRSYHELARAYGFIIDPTPPRSPQKKGKVERDAKYIKTNFLATLSDVDAKEAQIALLRWLREIAGKRVHGTTGFKPIETFHEAEKSALSALPKKRWEPVTWKQVTVHRDCHVQIDSAFYSVPWKRVGERLWARCRKVDVALFDEGNLVYRHRRVTRGQRSTVDAHLPEGRRDARHRSREYWVRRAKAIGDETVDLIERIFGENDVLSHLRRVQQIIKLLEEVPPERAARAARRALHFDAFTYRAVKEILRKGLDLEPLDDEIAPRPWATGSRFARRPHPTLFTDLPEESPSDGDD